MRVRRIVTALLAVTLGTASLPVLAVDVPALSVKPAEGFPGARVTIKGKKFPPNTPGNLQVGSSTQEVTTNGSGVFKISLLIPGDARGPTDIVADAGATAATTFTAFEPPPTPAWPPVPRTTWNWQLSGALDFNQGVEVFDIDGLDHDADVVRLLHDRNAKIVCYISAGSWENWRDDADDFPPGAIGQPLSGWPGERWFDIRHEGIRPPLEARMDVCADKGFDGIEFDNVDGYANKTGFPLTYDDQIAFNTWLAAETHERGMAVALKNDTDQIPDLVDDFDFAVNEECARYNECDTEVPFIDAGKAVFHAEYKANRKKVCAITQPLQLSTIFKKLKLDAPLKTC